MERKSTYKLAKTRKMKISDLNCVNRIKDKDKKEFVKRCKRLERIDPN